MMAVITLPLCFSVVAGVVLPADQVKRAGPTEDVVSNEHKYIFGCDNDSSLYLDCRAVKAICDANGKVRTDTGDKRCAAKPCRCKNNPKYATPKVEKVDNTKSPAPKNGKLECPAAPIPGITSMSRLDHCKDRGYTCIAMKIQLKGDLGLAGKDTECKKCTCTSN